MENACLRKLALDFCVCVRRSVHAYREASIVVQRWSCQKSCRGFWKIYFRIARCNGTCERYFVSTSRSHAPKKCFCPALNTVDLRISNTSDCMLSNQVLRVLVCWTFVISLDYLKVSVCLRQTSVFILRACLLWKKRLTKLHLHRL